MAGGRISAWYGQRRSCAGTARAGTSWTWKSRTKLGRPHLSRGFGTHTLELRRSLTALQRRTLISAYSYLRSIST